MLGAVQSKMNKKMKKSKTSPLSVLKEIGKRRRDQLPSLKEPLPVICNHNPKVIPTNHIPVRYRKHLELKHRIPNTSRINPFHVPVKDRFFYKEEVKKIPETPPMPADNIKTIIDDIHPEFFSVISGRPVRSNLDSKLYIKNVHGILNLRMDASYLNDMILRIETLLDLDENAGYENLVRLHHQNVVNFKSFLNFLYIQAQGMVKRANSTEAELEEKIEQLATYNSQQVILCNEILHLFDRFASLEMYRELLDTMAPLPWQKLNQIPLANKSSNFKALFLDSYEKEGYMKTVTWFRGTTALMYFKEPVEIKNVIDDLIQQDLHYLQIKEQQALELQTLAKRKETLTAELEANVSYLKFVISYVKREIQWHEEKEASLKEQFNKILNNYFKDTLAGDALALNTMLHHACKYDLHYIVESDTSTTLVRYIEGAFDEAMLKLESLDCLLKIQVTKQFFIQQERKMKKAYEARKILLEWERFQKSLTAAFQPPDYEKIKRNYNMYKRKSNVTIIKSNASDIGK